MGKLWEDKVFEMVEQRCTEADRDEDKAQNFLDFVTDTRAAMDKGIGSAGLHFTSETNCVIVTQLAIQTWAKKRGLKTSQRALKESARDLREAGLDIDTEPQTYAVGATRVWGVLCRREIFCFKPRKGEPLSLNNFQ